MYIFTILCQKSSCSDTLPPSPLLRFIVVADHPRGENSKCTLVWSPPQCPSAFQAISGPCQTECRGWQVLVGSAISLLIIAPMVACHSVTGFDSHTVTVDDRSWVQFSPSHPHPPCSQEQEIYHQARSDPALDDSRDEYGIIICVQSRKKYITLKKKKKHARLVDVYISDQ